MKNALNLAVTLSLTVGTVIPHSPLTNTNQPSLSSDVLRNGKPLVNRDATIKDGINEGWKIDEATKKGEEAAEVKDDWLHIASGPNNGNDVKNAKGYPAVFVNNSEFDFNQPGFFSTTIKSESGAANDRFGFYLGYNGPGNGLFLGYDAGGWFWQKYQNGDGDWYSGTRTPGPAAGEDVKVKIEWNENHQASLIVNNTAVFENLDFQNMKLSNKIGIKAGTYGTSLTKVAFKDMDYTGLNQDTSVKYGVYGVLQDDNSQAIAGAKITIGDATATSNENGEYRFDKKFIAGKYTVKISKNGYQDYTKDIEITDSDINLETIKLSVVELQTETIESADMKVELYKDFPAVRKYEMSKLGNKVLYGQMNAIHTVQINGKNITLDSNAVTYTKAGDNKAIYTMSVKDEANNIDAILTAEIIVDGNKLHFNITQIENKKGDAAYPIQTIAFPNHSLVSVDSRQDGASFTGAVMSSDTNKTGDETLDVTNGMKAMNNKDYMYAFVSNNELSASMWSNSENDGRAVASVAGGGKNTRIFATTSKTDDYTSVGLASAPWYYHRVIKDSKGNSYQVNQTDMPKMSIVITGDENNDKKVNWQDGAIAFRDIMNNPYKSEEVPELVAWRIAMNFGSQAQNPFLTSLDNVKKVALNTDGLGQSVLLKGYANEGHDSGHPDYGDIGKRIGGVKDFNTLMEKGKAYGARFGIHVNASEMYPEAKAFNEQMVRRNSAGGLQYGWNWLDQGVGIDGAYDLASGSREARFADLKNKVGDNMDFIYVDVWGNNTSGAEDSWETRKLSKMITDNGWRMTTEWGAGNEYDSTFQHWAADLTYGGSGMKGINSQVMRFLRNHQKDSWVGDYPNYGGAANAPLLGGYNMKDFEGWQGRNDYDAYITNLYTHDLSTKFIQHFKVQSWLNNSLDATAPKDASVNNGNEQIILKDDDNNTVVISRGSNDTGNADYRKRTMTLNGKVVLDGHVSRGDEKGKGDESYLLPWNWDSTTGENVASENEKLYHWNTKGGTTTWDLPDDWKNLDNVKVYKLTDLGKQDEKSVAIKNGQITLTADIETPYVITKGDEAQMNIAWSEGMHITDAGFNSGQEGLKKYWKLDGSGNASIAKSQYSNPMLKLSGDVSATQELTGLTPGKEYALYVGVDNRSDNKAIAAISSNGKELTENYTKGSIAKNYVKAYTHNTNSATVDGNSYFQNMYVFFTAPKDGSKVELTLKHEGNGDTYYDDVRVVENDSDNIKLDEKGNLKSFTNDFEKNVQGIYPFVISGSEGVEDNRIHLSEKHAPYTQAGWDVKKMDDVLGGDWSVKINGLTQKNSLIYQTIPQNLRFEPGKRYKVSFDYQAGDDDTFAVAIGSGEYDASKIELQNLKKSLGKTSKYEFEITGSLTGDTWFGVYSTAKAADLQGTQGSAADFGGYKDFVLDNLKVEAVQESFSKQDAENKLNEVSNPDKYKQSNYSQEAWDVYLNTIVQAKVLINKDGATQADYQNAYLLLRSLETYMEKAPGSESESYYDVDKTKYEVKAGSAQSQSGNEGPVEFAQDGNADTWWHTNWGDTNLNNAWYEFDLKEPTTIDGLRYLPRSGAENANGKILTYDIILTTDDGVTRATSQQTISGEFSPKTMWQKTSFKPVENVVSVRLKVNTSKGQSASQANHFASAAGLYITTTKDAPVITVDKTNLDAAIKAAEQLSEKDYTKASWKAVAENLANAKTVFSNDKASQYDVALAAANLQTAIGNLVLDKPSPVVVDKTQLNAAISNAQKIDTNKYTKDSVSAMQTALKEAIAVQKNDKATQDEVDAANDKLVKAVAGLKLKEEVKVNKTDLINKLNDALKINKNAYTTESFNALTKAIEDAQAVLNNENATQKAVNDAYIALEKAMNSLVAVKPGSGSTSDKDDTTKPDGSVNTGDTTDMGILFTALIVAGGTVFIIYRKKHKDDMEKIK